MAARFALHRSLFFLLLLVLAGSGLRRLVERLKLAKITRITPDTVNDLNNYNARTATVFAQTDQLTPALQPLDYPLYGTLVDIQALRPDLIGATIIAISGTPQKITLNPGVANLVFVPDQEGSNTVPVNPGDTYTLIAPPALPFNSDGSIPSWSTSRRPRVRVSAGSFASATTGMRSALLRNRRAIR